MRQEILPPPPTNPYHPSMPLPVSGGAREVVSVSADGIADAPAVVDGVVLRRPRLIQAILTRKERGVAGVQPMNSWL